MPLIQIQMLRGRSAAQKRKLLEAVTNAVHESLEAPLPSIRVWIQEFGAEEYMVAGRLRADDDSGA